MSDRRLLWVTPEPPDRSRGGGSIRQSHLLEGVGKQMAVDVIAIGGHMDEHCRGVVRNLEELPEPAGTRPFSWLPGSARALWEAEVLRLTPPVADTRLHRKLLAARLRGRTGGYDVVHLEHDRLAPLADEIEAPRRTITLHNLFSEQAAHRRERATSFPRRWVARRAGAVATAFEHDTARAFDVVFVTSPEDARALAGNTVVVPNGVDVVEFAPAPLPADPRMVFTGRLDWGPNVEGLQWFCNAVLPRIRMRVPTARLDIVGLNPVRAVMDLRQNGVEIHPDVPSTVPFLHAARIAVVPLHVGSGTRLKALEAMAAGRPVVGTRVGLAGLGLKQGVHASHADTAEDMAVAAAHLLRDDGAAAAMAAAAREHVEEHFDWRVISGAFARELLRLAEEAPAR